MHDLSSFLRKMLEIEACPLPNDDVIDDSVNSEGKYWNITRHTEISDDDATSW